MALVSQGYRLVVSLTDTSSSVSTLTFELSSPDALTAATDAATVLTALGDMTDSVVSSYSINEVFAENALTLPANAINAIKASMSVYLEGAGQKRGNLKIPAPKTGIFVSASGPNNNVVDDTDPAVIAYIDLYQTTGGILTLSDGETVRDADWWAGGKRISRGSQNP